MRPAILKSLLLTLLLAVAASGTVNAKLASGPQNLVPDLHQAESLFNLLTHQGKPGSSMTAAPESSVVAKGEAQEAFHYTSSKVISSIERQGLRAGSYATPNGDLSPLQAHIDLALPPNRGLPDSVLRIDLNGLRNAGYQIPEFTRVGRSFNMPGGGYEVQFSYAIPPEFIRVVPK